MNTQDMVSHNYWRIKEQISRYQQLKSKHIQPQILLLAVSKKQDIEKIRTLAGLGHQDFGESYVQEAEQKILALQGQNLCWHFIGPVQSNKTRLIARYFDWVHSVDRIKIARKLNQYCQQPLKILLQVNLNNEPQKAGFSVEELIASLPQLFSLDKLLIRGLMAIPEKTDDPQRQRHNFARLRQLLEHLQHLYPQYASQMNQLSMGMSNDLEAAILEGSTMVRVGSAIFGQRKN